MARIPDSFIQDLLARTDLVELIDARVPLKKAGRDYAACCPFHQEKSPSFTVSPEKGFYYCFGCGAKGNAIGFLMEYDRLNFPEAVEQLAGRVGMEVPKEDDAQAEKSRQRRERAVTLYDLLQRAEKFYRQQLKQAPERQAAVDFLKGRGLTGDIAARVGLGLAPPGFDYRRTHLSLDNDGIELALTAGLLVRREDSGRTYDKFRDRIMFPIRDGQGRTIGFGGRVLGDGKPKYLNSPETPVFHKGRELYGLWEWRQSREKSTNLFVVEGYMDVIALAQHGVNNAVATLGTATTEEHAVKLFRQVDEVVFCFDGDQAGLRAAWRALENTLPALEDGKQARFLFLPDGEDPDTLVRQSGREGFLALAAKAPALSQYLFDHLSEGLDLDTVDGRARLARLALPLLERVKGGAFRRLLQKALAEHTRLDVEDLEALRPAPAPRPAAPAPTVNRSGNDAPPPHDEEPPLPDDEPVQGDDMDVPVPRRERRMRVDLLERLILTLVQFPQVARDNPLPESLEELDEPLLDCLVELVGILQSNPDTPAAALLGRLMAMDHGELVAEVMRQSERIHRTPEVAQREWQDGMLNLSVARLEKQLAREERSPEADVRHIAALHQELAALRNRHRGRRSD